MGLRFKICRFQTPAERIYTTSNVTNTEHSWRFKLHRSKFTHRKAVAPARRLEFQTPAEEIYIVLFYENIAKSCMFQTPVEEIYTASEILFLQAMNIEVLSLPLKFR